MVLLMFWQALMQSLLVGISCSSPSLVPLANLEQVQRRATKMAKRVGTRRNLGMFSLKNRSLRKDASSNTHWDVNVVEGLDFFSGRLEHRVVNTS